MDARSVTRVLREARPGSGERVLVAVMNNARDLAIAREQGWYRIPVKRAPKRVGADYLALYCTGVFSEELRHRITFYAPIRAYRLTTRLELLPEESDHPRAHDRYFQIELGPLQRLDRPVGSRKFRRITFIPTTLARLLNADDITELWNKGRSHDEMWAALRAEDLNDEPSPDVLCERGKAFPNPTLMNPPPQGVDCEHT